MSTHKNYEVVSSCQRKEGEEEAQATLETGTSAATFRALAHTACDLAQANTAIQKSVKNFNELLELTRIQSTLIDDLMRERREMRAPLMWRGGEK